MNQITVKDMLAQMDAGAVFSIEFVTYDYQRKRGGNLLQYKEAKLFASEEAGRGKTKLEETKARKALIKQGRNPNHRRWYTRNIRILQEGQSTSLIVKIHPPLVTKFNDQIVVA